MPFENIANIKKIELAMDIDNDMEIWVDENAFLTILETSLAMPLSLLPKAEKLKYLLFGAVRKLIFLFKIMVWV